MISMKRFTLLGLLIVLLVTVAVASELFKEFPGLSEQDIIENEPTFNYQVLAIVRVIDGDTFEFWLHIAPRLAYFADVRLANVDTPEIRGDCKEEGFRVKGLVEKFLAEAGEIRVKLTGYSFGRWVCIVTVDGEDLGEWIKENKLTEADKG